MGFFDGGGGSIVSAAIGAGSSLLGGLMSQQPSMDYGFAREQWQKNYDAQKEFAQNGIRWKVADAKAAGLHPLAALGSAGAMYSPTSTAGDLSGGYDASWLGDMGQSIGRAVEAKMTREERAKAEAVNDEANQLKLENMRLQNESIKLDMANQLARDVSASQRAVRQAGLPPSMPSLRTRSDGATVGTVMPGQGDATSSSLFTVKPADIVASTPNYPGTEAGTVTDLGFTRTNDGGYAPAMSNDAKQRLEDDTLGEVFWHLRNSLPAALNNQRVAPPVDYLPDKGRSGDYVWTFSLGRGAWYPRKRYRGIGDAFRGIRDRFY